MMEKDATTRPLIYAEIGPTCERCTIYTVHVFGKKIKQTVNGDGHFSVATRNVEHLNEYFDREWAEVREITATIMEEFVNALERQGVEAATIQAAVEELAADVKC